MFTARAPGWRTGPCKLYCKLPIADSRRPTGERVPQMTNEERRTSRAGHGPVARTEDEDAAAFREAMRGVRPLTPADLAAAAITARAKPRARRPPARAAAAAAAESAAALPLLAEGVAAPERLEFRRSGVRDGEIRRMRRGTLRIEDELDLHGLTQARAGALFVEFLDDCRARGLRCVRIIHGKGTRSGARGPILKAAVDLWLRRRHEVLAYTSARPMDGGTGAVYVLLRA
jgi:DNA-nicking Smr family endonuclease